MDRREFLVRSGQVVAASGLGALLGPARLRAEDAAGERLNFVFILADDLGWADLNCYGNTIHETPNLNQLAREGMRFTDAYAACPVCSPTRASIMTGQYPARLGLTDWIPGMKSQPTPKLVAPAFAQSLPLAEATIAEALAPLGYVSGSVGKWHMGGEGSLPPDHGFDVNVGGSQAGSPAGGYFLLNKMDLPRAKQGEYLTDHLTGEGIAFIRQNRERPFFLYQSYHSVHTPIQSKPEYEAKYKDRQTALGRQFNAAYAGMVQSLDEGVGRILQSLGELGIADRTVVFFMSDNGGLSSVTTNAPLRAGKGWIYEGGIREPMIVRLPGVIEAGSTCSEPVSSVDFLPTIVDLAGGSLDHSVDGVSLVPLLRRSGPIDREAIYWHYPHYSPQGGKPASAMRMGDYKLIEFLEDGRLELYNLRDDVGEQNDLAGAMPKRAAEMKRALDEWRADVGAKMPTPNPEYEAAQAPGEKDAEFDVLSECAVDGSDPGYALRTKARGFALKKLDQPLAERGAFRLRLQSLQEDKSANAWRNGFLVFGSSPDESGLITCGLYLGGRRKVSIIEGFVNSPRRTEVGLEMDPYSVFEIEVRFDAETRSVQIDAGGKTVTATVGRPIGPVRYYGYAAANTVTAFSEVGIEGE